MNRRPYPAGLGIHHELKEWAEYFRELWTRDRAHEVRRDDRPAPYDRGHTVRITEYADHACQLPTGRWIRATITSVSRGPLGSNAAIGPGVCVFSIFEHGRGGPELADAEQVITPLDRKGPR
jgi:hypothetical protein